MRKDPPLYMEIIVVQIIGTAIIYLSSLTDLLMNIGIIQDRLSGGFFDLYLIDGVLELGRFSPLVGGRYFFGWQRVFNN